MKSNFDLMKGQAGLYTSDSGFDITTDRYETIISISNGK